MRIRSRLAFAGAATALTVALAACGSGAASKPPQVPTASATGATGGMPGMSGMPTTSEAGDGLDAAKDGYALVPATAVLPAGRAAAYRFTITGPDGAPVTAFEEDQTKKLHFYAIRSDLSGFQHVHPVMAADGTWTASLTALPPGSWRVYAGFVPATGGGKDADFVLSRTVAVPGSGTPVPLASASAASSASATTTVDGYTVTLAGSPMAGTAHELAVRLSRNGRPVTDLQPYLDSYAHLSAFHPGDLAFAHLHPTRPVSGDHGGPALAFRAEFAESGNWRVYLQFQTDGTVHTAALTLHVG